MSGWIKMGTGLRTHPKVGRIAAALGVDAGRVILSLYDIANMFAEHGNYGRLKCDQIALDACAGLHGMYAALREVGWMRQFGDVIEMRGFCKPSADRKSLGATLRLRVLGAGACVRCGSISNLEIDHIRPIAHGGDSSIENLQVLCRPCNRAKGSRP